jgi:hypothetical protein
MDKEAKLRYLYERVIQTANEFLYNAKAFRITVLNDHKEPTYEELAETIDGVCKVITVLCEVDDPLTGQRAYEYCAHMKTIAVAIKNCDQQRLDELTDILDRRLFV